MRNTKRVSTHKKYLTTVFLIPWCVGNAVGQTVEETASWIIKQTEVNPAELRHSIDGGVLMSHLSIGMNVGGLFGGAIEKGIPIGRVTGIVYTHTHEYVSYTQIRLGQTERPGHSGTMLSSRLSPLSGQRFTA